MYSGVPKELKCNQLFAVMSTSPSLVCQCPSPRVPEPCVFVRLKKFRGISGFKSHTGIFLSVGVVFLL